MSPDRVKVRFPSGGHVECAAWHYPGSNGACLVMAGGFGVTKEPATDLFASRFHDAGFTVLAFDYRHLGESGGQPRQVQRVGEQLADWEAAIAFAAALPEVDPGKLAIWGFSASGGHVLRVAVGSHAIAAAIAQTPNADGAAAARNAARHQKPAAMLRFTGRGIMDALGALAGRPPLLVPLAGKPGTVAVLTTPDALDSGPALNPGNKYPHWQQAVAARSALRLGFYQPGRAAARIGCPLLVVVCDQDQSALAEPGVRAAKRAPLGELFRMDGGHYAPFLAGHEQAVDAEVSWRRTQDPHAGERGQGRAAYRSYLRGRRGPGAAGERSRPGVVRLLRHEARHRAGRRAVRHRLDHAARCPVPRSGPDRGQGAGEASGHPGPGRLPVPAGRRRRSRRTDGRACPRRPVRLGTRNGRPENLHRARTGQQLSHCRRQAAAAVPLRIPGQAAASLRNGANLAPGRAVGKRTWEEYLADLLA